MESNCCSFERSFSSSCALLPRIYLSAVNVFLNTVSIIDALLSTVERKARSFARWYFC